MYCRSSRYLIASKVRTYFGFGGFVHSRKRAIGCDDEEVAVEGGGFGDADREQGFKEGGIQWGEITPDGETNR